MRLNPDISADDRAFVSNGIRSFFESALTRLFEKKNVKDSVEQVNKIFNIMVYIIGAISLTIAFFLLLISTTQNVKDAIWEYGVLRACGVTMEEGQRIQMYEAYIVVIAAAILGTVVGFCTALSIGVQFYMFIELPYELEFPGYLMTALIVIALITTWFAVTIPMKKVNERQIANVLKAST